MSNVWENGYQTKLVGNVITHDHNSPWARYVRACGRVAMSTPDSIEHKLALKFKEICYKAYLESSQNPNLIDKNSKTADGVK